MKVKSILLIFFTVSILCIGSDITLGINKNDKNTKVNPSDTLSNVPKDFGIELNPIFLIMSRKDNITLTGTISLFHINRKAEIAVPLSYYNITDEDDKYLHNQTMIIDLQYRKFLREVQKDFYFSGGIRYSYNEGYDTDLWWDEDIVKKYIRHKIGIQFGVGYRYFSNNGLYWGFSVYGGRYLTGTDIEFNHAVNVTDNQYLFWDIEFLKFGYSF